jgi:murein DD-endopeptidase MepM/ murein hydrolase activator NlpD
VTAGRMAAALVGALLLFAIPADAAATPAPARALDTVCPAGVSQTLCDQAKLLETVRQQLQASLVSSVAAQKVLQDSITANLHQQEVLKGRISDSEQRIAAFDAKISQLVAQIQDLDRRIEIKRRQVAILARALYLQPESLLMMVASARDLTELLTIMGDLGAAASHASDEKQVLAEQRAAADAERVKTVEARQVEVQNHDKMVAEVAQLQVLYAKQTAAAASLALKIAQTRYEIAAIDRQSTAVALQIAQWLIAQQDAIIAEAMREAWEQAQVWIGANGGTIPGISAGHSTKYRFIWPEPNAYISQPFGPTSLALEPPYGGYPHFHTGIDLVEPLGSPVFAADDGVVAAVGSGTTGYGTFVIVAHRNGYATLYGHLSTALVKVGAVVTQGQPVGLEGSSGLSTGPHVHFELRINGVVNNPAPFLPPGQPSAFRG